MPDIIFLLIIFSSSIAAGIIGSILGLGGGIIIVPVLTLFLKIDIHYAMGASIISVIATSSGATAAYVKEHLSNIRIGMFLEVATTAGALTGALIVALLANNLLFLAFGLVLVYSAIVMYRRRNIEITAGAGNDALAGYLKLNSSYYDRRLKKKIDYHVSGTLLSLGLMYIAGFFSGILGIGSGVMKVPAMDQAMRLPIKVSTSTSNFMIGVTAATTASVFFTHGYINPVVTAPVALGVLAGSFLGSRLMPLMPGTLIRRIFIILLVIVSVQMILKAFNISIGPAAG